MAFVLMSPAFDTGATIPLRHTCSGEDLSPPLEWKGAPEATQSFALVCSDPDAPGGTFYHWAIFDIPADQRQLAEGLYGKKPLVGGLRQAVNDFDRIGYSGPCPPRGHGIHHYHFRLFALDVAQLDFDGRAGCREMERAARQHSLAATEIIGCFER